MKETPTCIIFIDGITPKELKKFSKLIASEQSQKAVKDLTHVILAGTGMSTAILNQNIAKAILTTALRRDQKLESKNRKSRRTKK